MHNGLDNMYLVNYVGGSSGNFLITLIYSLLTDYTPLISPTKNAHHIVDVLRYNYKFNMLDKEYDILRDLPYKQITRSKKSIPFILQSHFVTDWDDLVTYYPNFKNVIITVDVDDKDLVVGNLFHKAWYHRTSAEGNKFWFERVKKFSPEAYEIIKNYNWPKEMPDEVVKNFIKAHRINGMDHPYFQMSSPIPEQYKDNILKISIDELYDINVGLRKIEEFVGVTASDTIIKYYSDYLIDQKSLIAQKMPWLDKYYNIQETLNEIR